MAAAWPGGEPGQRVDRGRGQDAARDAVAGPLGPPDEWLQFVGSQVEIEPVAGADRMRQAWDTTLSSELALDEGDPKAQLIGVVRAVGRDVATPGYRGCAFLNASAEFPDAAHPAHQICTAHTAGITTVVRALAAKAGLSNPDTVTDKLMLVINGLRASGAALGPPAVTTAVALANDIVQHASPAGHRARR